MNLNALEQDVFRRFGFATSSPDPTTQTRIRSFINETQQQIISEPGMEVLLHDEVTFASVASTPEYSLPPVIARIKQVRETTNRQMLGAKSESWYRSVYTDPTAVTGTPTDVVDLGLAAYATAPSAAAELFMKSTSASDDNTKTAYLEGYTTGGYPRSASVALNGVTAASFGATITDWIGITKFYIALTAGGVTTAAGSVTVNQTSGAGTELSRIPIGQDFARYRRIALAVCPASIITYTVEFERDVTDMSIATDEPVLPVRFHRLLATGARMKEYEKQDDAQRFAVAQAEYRVGLSALKHWVFTQAVGAVNLRGRLAGGTRASRLGAYFPAGT